MYKDQYSLLIPSWQENLDKETLSLYIIGAGGHGREICSTVRQLEKVHEQKQLVGIFADEADVDLLSRARLSYCGKVNDLPEKLSQVPQQKNALFLGIGDGKLRAQLVQRLVQSENVDDRISFNWKDKIIASDVSLGMANYARVGLYLAPKVTVTTNVHFGAHVHCNVGSTISHDCVLGDFVTLSPGVFLNGAVTVGNHVFFGTGSIVLPGLHIGNGAIIGAGAVVTKDVMPGQTVIGCPASPKSIS